MNVYMRVYVNAHAGYGLCWNERKSGYLLSGSYDHRVCVWDVLAEAGVKVCVCKCGCGCVWDVLAEASVNVCVCTCVSVCVSGMYWQRQV